MIPCTRRLRVPNRHRLTLALIAASAAPSAFAQATVCPAADCLPTDGTVRSGTISTSRDVRGVINPYYNQTPTNTLTISQTSRGGIIDWGTFNIGTGYNVQINNGSGVTLNRVVGFAYASDGCCAPTPSTIGGTLTATGSVFLINPAGITFSSGAQVNVGSLVASTLALSDADFNAGLGSGRFVFGDPAVTTAQRVDVEQGAAISLNRQGGTIGLLGGGVANLGALSAPGGTVGLASARVVTLDFFGDGLTQVTVSAGGLDTSVPGFDGTGPGSCLLYTSPSPRD